MHCQYRLVSNHWFVLVFLWDLLAIWKYIVLSAFSFNNSLLCMSITTLENEVILGAVFFYSRSRLPGSCQQMNLFIALCIIAVLAVLVSGDHTTACVFVCVCVGLMPGAQGLGRRATALVLHMSILAQSLAPLPPHNPLLSGRLGIRAGWGGRWRSGKKTNQI